MPDAAQSVVDLPSSEAAPADRFRLWLAIVVLASAAYVAPFVTKGWIPHDEGTLGLSATYVLDGRVPHIDYEDPYTGGLTWLHAAVFAIAGVDIAWTRWFLFGGVMVWVASAFSIASRFSKPWLASVITFCCLTWGFPNYFASMPSWWTLVLATASAAALLAYFESYSRTYLMIAAVMAGGCVAVKQTGVYIVAALLFSVAAHDQWRHSTSRRWGVAFAIRAAAAGFLTALAWLVGRHGTATVLLTLVLPWLGLLVYLAGGRAGETVPPANHSNSRLGAEGAVTIAGVMLPLLVLAIPYVASGHLIDFLHGAFVAPHARLQLGTAGLPPLILSWALVPVGVAFVAHVSRHESAVQRWWRWCAWIVAAGLLGLSHTVLGYQFFWNAARTGAAIVICAAALHMWRTRHGRDTHDIYLFPLAAYAAALNLLQFPFAVGVYFCYVAPMIGLLLFAQLQRVPSTTGRGLLAGFAILAGFSVTSLNTGLAQNVGLMRLPVPRTTPLDLPRASIRTYQTDAEQYRALDERLRAVHPRRMMAFPDCPEVYFLAGLPSPTRAFFEFFEPQSDSAMARFWDQAGIDTLVINHRPDFSGRPSTPLLSLAAEAFPHGARIGRFEVRWR